MLHYHRINLEVISISGLIPVNDSMPESYKRTVGNTEMTVHNVRPVFNSKEALDKEKKEISDTLYRIISKYEKSC